MYSFTLIAYLLTLAPQTITSVTLRGTQAHVTLATQVGHPYDAALIHSDVRQLWQMGRFDDIRVETTQELLGVAVVFHVVESSRLLLHKIRIEPAEYGLQLALPEGSPIPRSRANAIALEARKQLRAQGYTDARVDYDLTPFSENEVDLLLTVRAGARARVKEIDFTGDLGLEARELQHSLRAMKSQPVIPGWRLLPNYSPEAVDADLARLRSLYLSKGYFDASLRVEDTVMEQRDARIVIQVDSGTRDRAPRPDLCPSLLAQRRRAERLGILDFSATLNGSEVSVNQSQPYRIGRIEFTGNHRIRDSILRRSFLLEEGQPLDEQLLRESLSRLNATMLFEPINEHSVSIHTDEATGLAGILVRVTERKRGSWNLSGPVGPASFAGPLQASISSRLPPWGSGIFNLATYTASLSMFAFAHPLLPVVSGALKNPFLPVLLLQRPFNPVDGWRSGFTIAPQLGWGATTSSYAVTQIQQRLLPKLYGNRGLVSELPVTVETHHGSAVMFCEPPEPRYMPLRNTVAMAVRFLGAFVAY